jgi:ribosomal protein L21E
MVKKIIKEAMEKNPLGLKEAVAEELRARIALALEAKMEESFDLEEEFKVGDRVKVKTSGLSKETATGHKKYIGKVGKVVKDYGDGDLKVNFGGNDDRSISSGDLVKESVDLEEAKMTDAEVLSAAKSLAANGKDAKTKAFGKGLVDFYKKEGSFTPAQVGGLQNIMKNASFQMAKDK